MAQHRSAKGIPGRWRGIRRGGRELRASTPLRDHVRLRRDSVEFDYPAKSGVRRTVSLDDPLVIGAVRSLLRADTTSDRLLVYRATDGWSEVHADDINTRFRELVGEDFSVKDIRTWHGTVLAAEAFAIAGDPKSKTARRRGRSPAAYVVPVADQLGIYSCSLPWVLDVGFRVLLRCTNRASLSVRHCAGPSANERPRQGAKSSSRQRCT